jgi:hypothetical protein
MEDLEIFAAKFKEWRGDRRHRRFPSHFWEEIQRFIHHYDIEIVAKTIGVDLSYLQHKFRKDKQSKSITFTPLQVTSFPCAASIEFIDKNAKPMTIHFQADLSQLILMIHSLSGYQK